MDSCSRCKYQDKREDEVPCIGCIHNSLDNFKPMTNADRIRSMTDEELAEWLYNTCDFFENGTDDPKVGIWNLDTNEEEIIDDSYGDFLEWLKAERKR